MSLGTSLSDGHSTISRLNGNRILEEVGFEVTGNREPFKIPEG